VKSFARDCRNNVLDVGVDGARDEMVGAASLVFW